MGCCGSKDKPKAQQQQVPVAATTSRSVGAVVATNASSDQTVGRTEETSRNDVHKTEVNERRELEKLRLVEASEISKRAKQDSDAAQEQMRQHQLETTALSSDAMQRRATLYTEELNGRSACRAAFEERLLELLADENRRRAMHEAATTGSAVLENDASATRNAIAVEECDARAELEIYMQEELTVQELREKHLRDQQSQTVSPKPRRHNLSALDRLLAPLQGHCMPPCDMPESVVRLGKLPLRQRVREEIRMTREEMRRSGTAKGTSSFRGRGHADPYAHKDKSLSTIDDNLPPNRSTSVCSRGSHDGSDGHRFVRSASQSSAWAKDTSDRWNCEDYNLSTCVPRYSPRRRKARLPADDQRRAASGCTASSTRSASHPIDYVRERTPGPGSHTGPVILHGN